MCASYFEINHVKIKQNKTTHRLYARFRVDVADVAVFHALSEVNELQVSRVAREVVGIIHLAADERHVGANDPTAEKECSVPAGRVVSEVLVAFHATTPA